MSEREEEVQFFRMFIALAVPVKVQTQLGIVQKELGHLLHRDEIRWVRPEQIHLTLKFFGNIAAEQVQELTAVTKEACRRIKPLELRAKGIGFFPSEHRARVVWAAVEHESDDLQVLKTAVEEATTPFTPGAKPERFVGHLTIGRVKTFRPKFTDAFREKVQVLQERVFGEWLADSVEIVRSELTNSGSKYFRVAELPLEGRRQLAI